MVQARLTHINDTLIKEMGISSTEAEHLLHRSFNVSFAEKIPDDNAVVEGNWIDPDSGLAQLSVEKGMAESLGIGIGDTLSFSIGSEEIRGSITSIRSVLWENFKPNFYIIANRQLIEDQCCCRGQLD